MLVRLVDKRAAQFEIGAHEVGAALLGEQVRIGDNLVVTRTACVQASARLSDVCYEGFFDGHVDVFIVDVELELARFDTLLDAIEPVANRLGIFLADHALLAEHTCMGFRTSDVLGVQLLVDWQRCAEPLREFAHVFGETA